LKNGIGHRRSIIKGRAASFYRLTSAAAALRSLCGTSEAAVSRSVDYKVLMLLCNVDLKRKKERKKEKRKIQSITIKDLYNFFSVLLWFI